jgi:hypothetical protein
MGTTALSELVETVELPSWSCDIRDVEALGASRSPLERYASLDEMVLERSPELVREISTDGLRKNLAHDEIRILRDEHKGDFFQWYQWDGRVFLANSGGSHHFSAARYIAGQLGTAVRLSGRLELHRFGRSQVAALRREFQIFCMTWRSLLSFVDVMRALRAPFLGCHAPPPHTDGRIVLLPSSHPRTARVAEVLRRFGFREIGYELDAVSHRLRAPERSRVHVTSYFDDASR